MAQKSLQILYFLVALSFLTSKSVIALDVKRAINYAVRQYSILSERLSIDGPDSGFITTGDPLNSNWVKSDVWRWTAGFYGGTLWTLYSLTNDVYWKDLAIEFQERVKVRQDDTSTHDVGFVIMSTYGLCLEYTGDNDTTIPVIEQTAKSLSERFHQLSGVIRSWNNDAGHGGVPGEVKVIADNMMNLELLFTASKLTGNETFASMAISHADRTILEHFRPNDAGIFHVVAYNETNGDVQRKYNWQGLRDNSTWSRGLAWVIHGYITSYQLTNGSHPLYLQYSEKAADYFISHLPEDFIPYWDFDADFQTEYQPRDTSAAAIAAHGILKLYTVTGNPRYLTTVEGILENLNSPKYRSDGLQQYKIPSILVNGTVFYHERNFNTAIVYGDFYYLQTLKLYRDLV